jgi:hypothetical protein
MVATQLPLFTEARGPKVRRVTRPRSVSVLHEPEVAESVARRANLGCDLRSAFASFWATLPPERKAEIKARIAA